MKKIIINLICVSCLILTSCNALDQYPINSFTDDNFWTETRANYVLSQAYSQMYGSGTMFSNEERTDNLYTSGGNSLLQGSVDIFNGTFSGEWSGRYTGIRTCNLFLNNIDAISMNSQLKERMIAEARFIRAYQYFRLLTWFGDTPHSNDLISLSESFTISRKPRAEVLAWVRSELNDIVGALPTKQQYAAADNGRITKGAVMGMLARTYLYDNEWQDVATITEKIMNGEYGAYDLFRTYDGIFLQENQYNTEIMLDYGYVPEIRTWSDMRDVVPPSQGARTNGFSPTQELVNDYVMINGLPITDPNSLYNAEDPYVNRDPRFYHTIVYHGYEWKRPDGSTVVINIRPGSTPETNDIYVAGSLIPSQTGYYLRKWYDPQARQSDMASGLNIIMMRYADILLMYAEAKNELNQMNETVWNQTIRRIRARAGFTFEDALDWKSSFTQGELRDIIRRERRCELAIEGLRIFDLRRWKTAEIVLNGRPTSAPFANPALTPRVFNPSRDYLWPVPGAQIDINPNLLPNNPNW